MSIARYAQKISALGAILLVALGTSACTTVEGTNALVDFGTFEREVGQETLKGLGIIDRERKETIETPRAPLVLPKDNSALPAPSESAQVAALPEDSDKVQIDTTGLTEEDMSRLRNAKVFDLRSSSGRPLTEEETRKLVARMTAARITPNSSQRPLYLPPDEYFYTSKTGQDLVCLAANGDLVPVTDPSCPADVQAALLKQ